MVGTGCASLPVLILVLSKPELLLPVTCAIGFFFGGMVSGSIMEPVIRRTRWRFFYLAGSTPGTLVWAVAVGCLLTGARIENVSLWWVVGAWVPSMAGSLAGASLAYSHEVSAAKRAAERSARTGPRSRPGTGVSE